jgi:hypothetical protein
VGGTEDCTCNNPVAQFAKAINLVKEASKVLVDTRDTGACWDLLAKLLELPFFELLQTQALHSLLVHRSSIEGKEAVAA